MVLSSISQARERRLLLAGLVWNPGQKQPQKAYENIGVKRSQEHRENYLKMDGISMYFPIQMAILDGKQYDFLNISKASNLGGTHF